MCRMEDKVNLSDLHKASIEYLKYVAIKYHIKSYEEFTCPYTKKMAEIVGLFDKDEDVEKQKI